MIFMIGGTVVGIVLGALALGFLPQKFQGWVVLGLGAVALVLILPGLLAILFSIESNPMFFPAFTIPVSAACMVSGIGAVRKNYRPWQVWLGLGMGAVPVLFWILFIMGEMLYQH